MLHNVYVVPIPKKGFEKKMQFHFLSLNGTVLASCITAYKHPQLPGLHVPYGNKKK